MRHSDGRPEDHKDVLRVVRRVEYVSKVENASTD